MTKEEAKNELSKLIFELGFEDNVDDKVYALNMAIQALSQEPCDDAISREDALKLIYDFKENHTKDREKHPINYGTLLDLIRLILIYINYY